MTIMTQAQVISRWHQEGEELLLTEMTEDWMRGFILRLQDSSSALRTNSKQALRKRRKTDSSSFQNDSLDEGVSPSERRAAKSQKLRNHVLSCPGVFLPPPAPSVSLFSFSFFFFACFWDYSSQHTLNRRLSGRFRDECVLNCLFIGG